MTIKFNSIYTHPEPVTPIDQTTTSIIPKRAQILDEAKKTICQDRQDIHGAPEDSFKAIANYWTNYLGIVIEPKDAAVMMCLFKIARYSVNPNHKDNLVDTIGYAAIAAELGDV